MLSQKTRLKGLLEKHQTNVLKRKLTTVIAKILNSIKALSISNLLLAWFAVLSLLNNFKHLNQFIGHILKLNINALDRFLDKHVIEFINKTACCKLDLTKVKHDLLLAAILNQLQQVMNS